jgi:hypothetical protein
MHGRFALLDAPFRESLTGSGSFGAYDTGRCTTRALKLASWPTLGSQPDNGSVKRSEIRAHPATRIGPRAAEDGEACGAPTASGPENQFGVTMQSPPAALRRPHKALASSRLASGPTRTR